MYIQLLLGNDEFFLGKSKNNVHSNIVTQPPMNNKNRVYLLNNKGSVSFSTVSTYQVTPTVTT